VDQTFGSLQLRTDTEGRRRIEIGACLITGGLGGVGLVLAEYLAQSARETRLVGRSTLLGRDSWGSGLLITAR
jgi:hypothetical protein